MIRLNIIVEGDTEEAFVNLVLLDFLTKIQVICCARRIGLLGHRGGNVRYERLRKDLRNWMREDQKPDARFTTMLDLYKLGQDFPGMTDPYSDPYGRVKNLEDKLWKAVHEFIGDDHHRFLPYIQLHEYEAILFTDPSKFVPHFEYAEEVIPDLMEIKNIYNNPELINDGQDTAPSKRIIQKIPQYKGRKATAGPSIAKAIGLAAIRSECRHFNEWLVKLESLH